MEYERKLFKLRQTKSASSYADEFRRLISYLGWNDPAAMAFFYEGLKDRVKDVLCIQDRPATLAEYITMAISIDNKLYRRLQERRSQGIRHGN